MAKLLQIAELGRPVLRQKAETVQCITDPVIQDLIDDLLATMIEIRSYGLAAPQVHSAMRLFVMSSEPTPNYPDAPRMGPTAAINPSIIAKSHEMDEGWERCLSIPGMRGKVQRHKQIEVEYSTRAGKRVNASLQGMLAIIFQHEFDHLEGLVYLGTADKAANLERCKSSYRQLPESDG